MLMLHDAVVNLFLFLAGGFSEAGRSHFFGDAGERRFVPLFLRFLMFHMDMVAPGTNQYCPI
jgi:hypothetical protein